MTDDFANWQLAITALRLRAVVNLDVFPHEDEPVDLVLLLMLRGRAG
jgi:hypothetical protein